LEGLGFSLKFSISSAISIFMHYEFLSIFTPGSTS
jgi:hypothetical protein